MSWLSGAWQTWKDSMQASTSDSAEPPPTLNYQPRQSPIRRLIIQWGQSRFAVDLPRKSQPTSVADLKAALSAGIGIPPDKLLLVCAGVQMQDEHASLARYRLRDQGLVTLKVKGGEHQGVPGAQGTPAPGVRMSQEHTHPTPAFEAQQAAAAARKTQESDQSEAGVKRRILVAQERARKELLPEVDQLERSVDAIESTGLETSAALQEVDQLEINGKGANSNTSGLLNLHQVVFSRKKLSELLLQLLLSLDNVQAKTDELRSARKRAVNHVQSLLDRLDAIWTKAMSLGVKPDM